jgi:endonuclease/exonuclease/phosphatase family metal-dependent hydrolase
VIASRLPHFADPAPRPALTGHSQRIWQAASLDAILCGEFNFEPYRDGYRALTDPAQPHPFIDSSLLVNATAPHPPTFRLYDDTHGPDAVSCDFFFVSEYRAPRVRHMPAHTVTQASDHQPVLISLA